MSENIKQCKLFGEFQNYYGTNNRNVSAKKKQAAHQEVNDSGVAADTLAANIHTFRPQLQLLRWFRFSFTVWQAIRPKRKPTANSGVAWMFAVEGGTTLLDLWPFLCERVLSARWKRLPGFQCHQLPRLNLTLRELFEMFFSDPQGKNAVGYYFIVYVLDLAYGQWYN